MQFQRFLGERALAAVFTRLEPYGFWVMVYYDNIINNGLLLQYY